MTQTIQSVGRVRALEEVFGSFAVEGNKDSFVDVPIIEGSNKLTMESPYDSPKQLQQHIDGYPVKVAMPKRARFDTSINIRGSSARGTSGNGALDAADVTSAGHLLWKVGMGAVTFGTGTTIATTSTTTVLNVTSAAGLTEGGAIAIATGTGGALECREIKQISTNAVTLKLALSSVPTNGMDVLGCVTYSLGNLDGSTVTALQLIVEGLDALDRWLLYGGQYASPPKLNLVPGTIPTADFSWLFVNHAKMDGTETVQNVTGDAVTDQNYSSSGINAVVDSSFRIQTHGVTTLSGTFVDASEINIAPNIVYEPHVTPGGIQNVKQWVRTRADGPAVTGDFLLPYESVAWRTARASKTALGLTYQVGSSVADGGFMVAVPHVIVDNFQREAVGGIAGQRVSWYARLDNQTNSNSTALQKSALRIHMF